MKEINLDTTYFRVNECVFPYLKIANLNTERVVEIPLGEFFINNFGFGVTEIGNSMSYFNFNCGSVLSIQEALDNNLTDKNVLSIGVASYNLELFQKIIFESKNYLLTHPIGINVEIDIFIRNSNLPRFILERVTSDNLWKRVSKENFDYKYNSPYPYGNAICCVTNLEVLL